VSERLVCSSCRRPFEPPADKGRPWVECPNCQARNINPETLEKPSPRQGWAVLGMLLIIFSAGGGPCGACIVSFATPFGRSEDHSAEAIATLVGFLILLAGGILLMVMGARPPDQRVGPGTTIFGATVLALIVGLSAIIYGFSVCF
jgi:LSD1 subclass zinc finger protein